MTVWPRVATAERKIEFKSDLEIDKIRFNPLNPRKVFREKDINDLCNSIIEMGGILVPLVVFQVGPDEYVLLDGERRLRAAMKLKMKTVPVNIIPGDLPDATNLSTMFNIHMARVPWNPAARALALGGLKGLFKGISEDRLSEITGMSKLDIKDAERILSFPQDIIERCLHEGLPDYLRPANLVEMAKAFEAIKEYLPTFFKEYDKEKVARIFVQKRDDMIIPRNTDFRLIRTMLRYLSQENSKKLIVRIIEEEEIGIADIYKLVEDQISSERLDLFKNSCVRFMSVLRDFNPKSMDEKSAKAAKNILSQIRDLIDQKLLL